MSDKLYKKSIFIFARDLRLLDNTGLYEALHTSDYVIPLFNFDPIQVGKQNEYRSDNIIQFMCESLKDLEAQLKDKGGKLYFFYGDTIKNIHSLIRKTNADAVFLNYDYTPFATKRNTAIANICKKEKINFHGFHDELLIGDPATILTGNKTPYGVYSAFYKKAVQQKVNEPASFPKTYSFYTKSIDGSKPSSIYKEINTTNNLSIKVHGGRDNALKILKSLNKFKNYAHDRNLPALDATTHLSAFHKFNVISIRESYHAIKKALGAGTQLLKELYWRDFFTYVAFHNPHVFGKPYHKKYEDLDWNKSKKDFEKWCEGTTGFPIVDAGMRQLNTTGWMHNRVRMIVASFLVKDLHINWLWGEKYFAQKLVDYDPAVNNGNWQWAASTGCDAQPYFRIFNPWTQQKKFDPDCTYIKKWIPELKNIDNKIIHTWFKDDHEAIKNYPTPMLNHDEERKITLKIYKKA